MSVAFAKQTLPNGLQVIVHEDRRIPIVAVNIWYHVGSKNEEVGRTGFAHLFEHLMFEGSAHHDCGFFRPLQEAGGALNGSTNADRTNYWEVVPTNALELALWMESDRMGYLLPALTPAKFDNQRSVVLNERRQNYENRPFGLASMAIMAALYPPDHPYHWLTIGSTADLQQASLSDARAFFHKYYHPGNASLVLAGDVDAGEAFELVHRYFEEIPRGPDRVPVTQVASPTFETRLVMEDRVELPRLYVSWHSPALFNTDDAELDLLSGILAGGKSSRLYRSLVYERRVAVEVAAIQNSREMAGFFQVAVTAAPGTALETLETAILEELESMATAPFVADFDRSVAQAEAQFVYRLETVGGFGGKSDQLNAYNTFLRDPGFFDEDLRRYRAATTESVRAATQTYLRPDCRVCLSVVPQGRLDLAAPHSSVVTIA